MPPAKLFRPRTLLLLLGVALAWLAPAPLRAQPPPHPLVVGYLPQWGLYADPPWLAQDLIRSGAAALLDQVNYAQANIRNGRCVIADPEADLNHSYTATQSIDALADQPSAPLRGGLHQLALLKRRYPHLRTLISIEGQAALFAQAAQPGNREAFVASCLQTFIAGHLAPGVEAPGLFDGIDLDWEFPQAADGENYMALLAEFRRQLDALEAQREAASAVSPRPLGPPSPGGPAEDKAALPSLASGKLILSVAVGPGVHRYPGVDWTRVAPLVNQVGLMNYDYHGPWQGETGLIAPLYPVAGGPPMGSVDSTVREYEAAGIPPGKLLLGVPFYGYHWGSVGAANHGLFQPGVAVHEDNSYREIAALAEGFPSYRDEHSGTPWLYDGHTFWTWDDPISARIKASYAGTQALGGVMVWELSGDSPDAAMLRAIATGLRTPAGAPSPASPMPTSGTIPATPLVEP